MRTQNAARESRVPTPFPGVKVTDRATQRGDRQSKGLDWASTKEMVNSLSLFAPLPGVILESLAANYLARSMTRGER